MWKPWRTIRNDGRVATLRGLCGLGLAVRSKEEFS